MLKRARPWLLAGTLILVPAPALLPAFLSPGVTCASAAGAGHAALVVGTGSRTKLLCVSLDATSVSGIHLIELAHAQDGLQYSLGFGGLAVCQLDGVGPSGSDCFSQYPQFWGLWLGDRSGGWSWSGSGAGSVRIRDGDTEAWTWGAGDSGSTHPAPPAATVASVCGIATATPTATPTPTRTPPRTGPTQSHSPVPEGAQLGSKNATPAGKTRAPGSPGPPSGAAGSSAAVTPGAGTSEAAAAAGPGQGGGGGSPAGALLAVLGALTLGGAGWLRMRAGAERT